jgi:hypothetical protein
MDEAMDRDAILKMLAGEEAGESPTPNPDEQSPTAEEPTAANEEVQVDDQSYEEESAETEDTGGGEDPDPETESRYEKLRKAEARQKKTWQKLDEEKRQLRELKEQLEAERGSIEQERLRVAEELSKAGTEHSPDIYDQVAQKFEDEGEPELAEQARKMAEESRNRKQSASKTVEVEKFKKEWSESVSKLSEENPELKDADSELFKAVKYLLDNKPALTTYSTGFQDAVEVAKYYVDSQNLERITIENKKLKTELSNLKKKTNLGGGNVMRRTGPKGFDDMSHSEQRNALLKMVREADR